MALSPENRRHRKKADAALLAMEAEKSLRAAVIGKATGLFYVPEILRCDAEERILEFEWLEGLESLFTLALRRDPRVTALCERAGAALSAVHSRLRLPDNLKVRFAEPALSNSDSDVFVHGDFNGDNVCYDSSRDRLVIVDWSSAPQFGGKPTFGSPYFDLLWFGHFFFCSRPAAWLGVWQDLAWHEALIRGYASQAGAPFPGPALNTYRSAAEPVFSAARKRMLANAHGLRRIVRGFVLWRAGIRWRHAHLNENIRGNADRGSGGRIQMAQASSPPAG